MVSAAKILEKEPPREPLTTAAALVRDFKWRYADRDLRDGVVEFCRSAPNLKVAVDRAVRARDENGKHHNHQSKVRLTQRLEFGKNIIDNHYHWKRVIKLAQSHGGDHLDGFDAMYDYFDLPEIKPWGIGPVTVYDVAVRVGAFLGIEPTSVYMHAGVRAGVRALERAYLRNTAREGLAGLLGASAMPRVPLSAFPKPFRRVGADMTEDILCTYREVIDMWDQDEEVERG